MSVKPSDFKHEICVYLEGIGECLVCFDILTPDDELDVVVLSPPLRLPITNKTKIAIKTICHILRGLRLGFELSGVVMYVR
jgi:hypothetical protein